MLDVRLLSSLEKVFFDEAPNESPFSLNAFQAETVAFQLAFRDPDAFQEATIQVESNAAVSLRLVQHVPVRHANYPTCDPDTLRGGASGLYPDLLTDLQPHELKITPDWTTVWVDAVSQDAGSFPITLRLLNGDLVLAERTIVLEVLPCTLPQQQICITRWFHCDGLAQYYGVEVFSEEHWSIIEKYLRCATRHGMNMLLTPIHTPPLDTAIGHERLTTQLVDITLTNGTYHFNVDKLRRWIRLALSCGIKYFEMAHLYTQWGAHHAPSIMATVDGIEKRVFGWETNAVCQDYRHFLEAYIPAIRQVLREEGVDTVSRWHVSDEPFDADMDTYLAARRQIDDLLDGCVIMDALSNFAYYQQGIVAHPVVATDHAQAYIDASADKLWVYYCCAQYKKVSNMFIAMPSCRNRIIGFQLFRHKVEGFLHWGFNFYNSMFSWYQINPYLTTDADCGVPAGDPFLVYPGKDGNPLESIRQIVFDHALNDLRACELLASIKGRAYVEYLLDEAFDGYLTFESQADAEILLALRKRINQEIIS